VLFTRTTESTLEKRDKYHPIILDDLRYVRRGQGRDPRPVRADRHPMVPLSVLDLSPLTEGGDAEALG
jgi:hypothetical protein